MVTFSRIAFLADLTFCSLFFPLKLRFSILVEEISPMDKLESGRKILMQNVLYHMNAR